MTRKIISALALAAAVSMLIATGASAHARYNFERRIDYLAQKIESGRRLGSITYTEGLRLRRLVRNARDLLQSFEADGVLSSYERRTLRRELDEVLVRIQEERRDSQRRPGFLPRIGA